MTATAEEIARLRRMCGLADSDTDYSESILSDFIERYPIVDARGESPYVESTTTPGTLEINEDWTATYDLNVAAADIWDEKAAALVDKFDFNADGHSFQRSQQYTMAANQARRYRSRRNINTVRARPEPRPPDDEDDLSN